MHVHHARQFAVALVATALVVAFAARQAHAQALGIGEVSTPGVTRAHLDRAEYLFQPTEQQQRLIDAAYETYLASVRDTADTMREVQQAAFSEYRDTGNPEIWRDLIPVVDRYEAYRDTLDERFLDEFRLILTPEQDERWERFERDRRRMLGLADGGLVSGDDVDLVDIVETTRLSESARVAAAPVLDRYAAEMDRLLTDVGELRDELERRSLDVLADLDFTTREPDFTGLNELLSEATAAGVQVREANRRYAALLARTVGGEEGARIERAFLEAAYPAVYRTSTAERTIRAALTFDDLSPAQRDAISTLADRYDREVSSANEQWVEAIRDAETGGTVDDLFSGIGFGDEAERNARRDRRDLDRRYADRVRELLTDEQAARLPAPARLESERRLSRDADRRSARPTTPATQAPPASSVQPATPPRRVAAA
jgi:Spy/CpxP family protein refolding chaperone